MKNAIYLPVSHFEMFKQTASLKNSGLKLVPKKLRAVLLISYYYLGLG